MRTARNAASFRLASRDLSALRECVRRGGRLRPCMRILSSLALVLSLAGCERGIADALTPDFHGTWDVTYDDAIAVEVALDPEAPLEGEVSEEGGQLAFGDAGVALQLDIDCSRPELVCPAEVWPRELTLSRAPGRLDDDGMQLSEVLRGKGNGRCLTRPGSIVTGEVVTTSSPSDVRPQAVALTSGRVRIVVDAACVAPHAGLPSGTELALSTGFTAAKR